MKYTIIKESQPNAMRLQSIGWVQGTPAGQVKTGDVLMWNFGDTSTVGAILKETDKTIVAEDIAKSGKIYTRKLLKTRLVCILK